MADVSLVTRAHRLPVIRERDENEFETIAWPYIAALPIFYLLGGYVWLKKLIAAALQMKPRMNCLFVDGISINSRRMKDGATRWPSLDTCYNFTEGQGRTLLHRMFDQWWMKIRNAQAVRNRLKIAKRELRIAIEAKHRPGVVVKILSLASGSAQGVIEVSAELAKRGIQTQMVLIDQDESALAHASRLAAKNGITITTIKGNILKFKFIIAEKLGEYQADIVEMMGFLDYVQDSLAEPFLRRVYNYLTPGSLFFCCHIHPNHERFFLKWAVNWDNGMLYRTVSQFTAVLHRGGFLTSRVITEPLGIHSVSIAEKEEKD